MNILNIRTIFLLIPLIFGYLTGTAQDVKDYPVVGQPCPDFELTNVAYFPKKKVKLSDLKGKSVILDFWSKTCGLCIASFPHADQIQKAFKDDLIILPVGEADKQRQIEPLFERIRKTQGIDLPSAFDSVVIRKFVPDGSVPNLVWIDQNGIVKAVTMPKDLNEENIKKFISGEVFYFDDISHEAQQLGIKVRTETDFLKYSSDSTTLYNSKLMFWTPGLGLPFGSYQNIDEDLKINGNPGARLFKYGVKDLYCMAYMGTDIPRDSGFYNRPILELRDSTFAFDNNTKMEKFYNYSLEVPKSIAGSETFKRIMQNDLKSYFGYIVKIENRIKPRMYLVVKDQKKVDKLISKTQGKTGGYWKHVLGGELINLPMQNFVKILRGELPGDLDLYDETGLEKNINVKITGANVTYIPSLREALNKIGFDLVERQINMKCFVIVN